MVGGAKAGMRLNGNLASVSTPITPVSIDILVRTFAKTAVMIMSINPKVFQTKIKFLAYDFCFFMVFTTKMLVIAVITSPKPAMKANVLGRESYHAKIINVLPINLKMCSPIKSLIEELSIICFETDRLSIIPNKNKA